MISSFKLSIKISAALFMLNMNLNTICCQAKEIKIDKAPFKTVEEAIEKSGFEGVKTSIKTPTNFPLPVYSSNIVSKGFTNTTKGTPMAQLSLVTRDAPKTVFDWYKTQCSNSGWEVRSPKPSAMTTKEKAGQLFILSASKGEEKGMLTISVSAKHPETRVSIIWMKHA